MQLLPATTKPLAECAHRVLDTVPPVIWFIRHQMRSHRKNLSLPQFRTLVAVDREPALSLSTLADHLGSSMPTASRMVAGLVRKGLLARKGCDEDRRQCALAITPAGRAVVEGAWSDTQTEMEKRLRHLTPRQQQSLCTAMDTLREIFGSAGLPSHQAKTKHPGTTPLKSRSPSRGLTGAKRA